MKNKFSGFTLLTVSLASVAATLLICILFFTYRFGGTDTLNSAVKFAEVYGTIDKSFVGEADMEEVSDIAYAYMVQSLDDRWSYYMTADQYTEYKQFRQNNYTGIGVTIEKEEDSGYFVLKVILEGSPAQEAGMEIGDVLKKINDTDLKGLESADVKQLITDQNGEEFRMTFTTPEGEDIETALAVGIVHNDPVSTELLNNGVGYIKIRNFEGGSADGTIDGVENLIDSGATGIVFDVRNNPGGTLQELLDVLDYLLPQGDIFISRDENGDEKIYTSDDSCVEIPMVVLVNENTYSAAEFFPAALSEYGYATIIGKHTTGKARSQMNIELVDGSALHLSTRGYLTPERVDLAEQGGIAPDISVDLTEEEGNLLIAGQLPYEDDEQLKEAVSVIKIELED